VRRVINLRVKVPGIIWLQQNANKVLHMRAQLKLGQWDSFVARALDELAPIPTSTLIRPALQAAMQNGLLPTASDNQILDDVEMLITRGFDAPKPSDDRRLDDAPMPMGRGRKARKPSDDFPPRPRANADREPLPRLLALR
jgi:hypothetical protein